MSRSIWIAPSRDDRPPLRENLEVEVCVIGGGVAGLTTAYLLAREGRSVVVLEGRSIGDGETSRSTAQLVTALDRGWAAILRGHGAARAALAAESHLSAIDRIEALVQSETISCDFARLDGFLLGGNDPGRLRAEHAALQTIGLGGVSWIEDAPLGGGPALRFAHQAQMDPVAYAAGLARALEAAGGRIACATRADAVDRTDPFVVRVSTGATVRARSVVIATNAPIVANLEASLKQYAYRTYVVAGPVPHGAVGRALYWDLEDPFHYVRLVERPRDDFDLLLVGGEDHRTGQAEGSAAERYERLATWARSRVREFRDVTAAWSGQVLETMDGLAFIGAVDRGLYVVTGDSGNGMTHAMVAGTLISDLVHERPNPWREVYDPARFRMQTAFDFVRENLSSAVHFLDHLTPGDIRGVEQLAPGEGGVLRRGLTKIAAYRDGEGRVHQCSAVCPHLGCIVKWNAAESSWDCPCHGSRFSARGRLLNGPANRDLAPDPAEADAEKGGHDDADPARYAFRGVILDVDGTLLDSNEAHANAWAEALAEFGVTVAATTIRPLVGMGGDKLLPKVSGITADGQLGKAITRRRGEIFRTRWLPQLQPFPDARKLLLELRGCGQRLVVATSAERDDLDGLLRQAGIDDLIDARATSDDAEHSKPDPDIVQVAMKRALVPSQALVMIGDTPYDVEAGAGAGIPVIALRCGGSSSQALAGSLLTYEDPAELANALHHSPLAEWFGDGSQNRHSGGSRSTATAEG